MTDDYVPTSPNYVYDPDLYAYDSDYDPTSPQYGSDNEGVKS